MSGDLTRACLAIVKSARNRPMYYAEQLFQAMKGIGTNNDDLIRLLVTRSEVKKYIINSILCKLFCLFNYFYSQII
jgi:hypothetical protein